MNKIAGVRGQIVMAKVDDQYLSFVYFGNYTDVESDWDIGEFKSTFNGDWLTINDQPVYVKVISELPVVNSEKIGTEMYSIPITLNGEVCSMTVVCEYPSKRCRIVEIHPEYNDATATDDIRGVKKGDIIKPIYLGVRVHKNISDNEEAAEKYSEEMKKFVAEYQQIEKKLERGEKVSEKELERIRSKVARLNIGLYEGDPISIGNEVSVKISKFLDGNYFYAFEFIDPLGGQSAISELNAVYTIEKGKITALRSGDDIETPDDL